MTEKIFANKKFTGLTLVELLVGIVVGLVVLSAAGGAMMSYMRSYSDSQRILSLNQNMRAVMDVMARDIRRAGYVTDQIDNLSALRKNPFFEEMCDLRICDTIENPGSCISFSYDINGDSTVTGSDNKKQNEKNEIFGFRLNNKVLEIKKSGKSSCENADFQYEGLSDFDISIDKLIFTINGMDGLNINDSTESCTNNPETKDCLYVRSVRIELTASTNSEPKIQQTLVQTVKIRNDKFTPKTVTSP